MHTYDINPSVSEAVDVEWERPTNAPGESLEERSTLWVREVVKQHRLLHSSDAKHRVVFSRVENFIRVSAGLL